MHACVCHFFVVTLQPFLRLVERLDTQLAIRIINERIFRKRRRDTTHA